MSEKEKNEPIKPELTDMPSQNQTGDIIKGNNLPTFEKPPPPPPPKENK
jgi:hypothetical protein